MRDLSGLEVFLVADYGQMEIRVLAEASGDPKLLEILNSGEDPHCLIGHELTGFPKEKIASDENLRTSVKGLVFGVNYGEIPTTLYANLKAAGVKGITLAKTEKWHRRYFERFKGVRRYHERLRSEGERNGAVESIFGFRRELGTWDDSRGTYWGNQAINTPIQSAAHHLMLMAMAILHLKPKTYSVIRKVIAEVHDALYFRVRLYQLPEAYALAKNLMEKDVIEYCSRRFKRDLKVALVVDCKAGFLLGTMVKYKGEPVNQFLDTWRAKYKETSAKELERDH